MLGKYNKAKVIKKSFNLKIKHYASLEIRNNKAPRRCYQPFMKNGINFTAERTKTHTCITKLLNDSVPFL